MRVEIERRQYDSRYPDSLVAFSSTRDYPQVIEYRGVVRDDTGRVIFEGEWIPDWNDGAEQARAEAEQWIRDNQPPRHDW